MNPDYPNVTTIARRFFEEREDWENAVELAVNEAKRTESLVWFDILGGYVEQGVTKVFAPSYFAQALAILFYRDKKKFEQLVTAFWNSCRHEDAYFTWVNEINHLLLNL
ncbi:GTP-binding protein, partial [Alkalihalophilus lindianensis]|nr:GTP-binding protein [Alkalihalophilus lindianensis]